jgi:hypothetical protein
MKWKTLLNETAAIQQNLTSNSTGSPATYEEGLRGLIILCTAQIGHRDV